MYCPKCGKEQIEQSKFCFSCGAPLTDQAPVEPPRPTAPAVWATPEPIAPAAPTNAAPAEEPVPIRAEKKRIHKKPILIGAAALVLALLVGVGLWFLLRKDNKKTAAVPSPLAEVEKLVADIHLEKLEEGLDKSSSDLRDYVSALPNLNRVINNVDAISTSGVVSMDVNAWIQNNVEVKASGALDRTGRSFCLQADLERAGQRVTAELYADKTQLQVASSELLGEGEVYALPLEKLTERWNSSSLSRMLNVRIPSYIDTDALLNKTASFSADKVTEKLRQIYGEDWTNFAASIQLREKTENRHFTQGGVSYTVEWDSSLIKTMGEKANDRLKANPSGGPSSQIIRSFLDLDLNEEIADMLVDLFYELDQNPGETEILMDDSGRLIGFYRKSTESGSNSESEYLLCGENNPWERITIRTKTWYSVDDTQYEWSSDQEIITSIANQKLTVTVQHKSTGSFGTNQTMNGQSTSTLVYDDTDGSVQFYDEDGESRLDGTAVQILPEGSGVTLRITGNDRVFLTLRPEGTVQRLSSDAKDILTLSEDELKELVFNIQRRVKGFPDN